MHKTLSKVNILIPRLLIPDVTNPKQNIPLSITLTMNFFLRKLT